LSSKDVVLEIIHIKYLFILFRFVGHNLKFLFCVHIKNIIGILIFVCVISFNPAIADIDFLDTAGCRLDVFYTLSARDLFGDQELFTLGQLIIMFTSLS